MHSTGSTYESSVASEKGGVDNLPSSGDAIIDMDSRATTFIATDAKRTHFRSSAKTREG
jgi:hypothetical protein